MLYSAVRFPGKSNLLILMWRAISFSNLKRISFVRPWLHFLGVSRSWGCGFWAILRAHDSAGSLVLQLRGPHLRI